MEGFSFALGELVIHILELKETCRNESFMSSFAKQGYASKKAKTEDAGKAIFKRIFETFSINQSSLFSPLQLGFLQVAKCLPAHFLAFVS